MAKHPKYEIFKGKDEQFYFRLTASNGENILSSEGYASKQGAKNGIESVRNHAGKMDHFDKKETKDARPFFSVTAVNGQILGHSESYSSAGARDNGIASFMKLAGSAPVEDTTTGAEYFTNPKFQVFETKNGQFAFRLNAVNGENLLQSETYTSKAAAKHGVESVINNAQAGQFEKLESKDGQYYFNLKAGNGEIIGSSEGFASAAGRDDSIGSILRIAGSAPVEDTTLFDED